MKNINIEDENGLLLSFSYDMDEPIYGCSVLGCIIQLNIATLWKDASVFLEKTPEPARTLIHEKLFTHGFALIIAHELGHCAVYNEEPENSEENLICAWFDEERFFDIPEEEKQ